MRMPILSWKRICPILTALLMAQVLVASGAQAYSSPPGAHGSPPRAYETTVTQITALAKTVLASYQRKSSPDDPRYYRDGLWISDDMGCWPCNLGPAVADAVLARRDPTRIPVVVASFDRAIRDHHAPDGSFAGDAIDTAFFVPELGTALIALGPRLSADTRHRWSNAIVRGAEYLIRSGNTTWYVNGNINLAYTEVLYLAWRISHQQRFAVAYEASWTFLTDPPKPRWAGYGLIIKRSPKRFARTVEAGRLTKSNAEFGYLAESNGGPPGFDPEYTQLQLDAAASLFVLTHDPRALRLMNLLMNAELPRVNSTFVLNATDGSRHSLYTPFLTSALALLVRYGRPDLAPLVPAQTAQMISSYKTFMVYTHRNFYFGLSRWLAPLLLDASDVEVVSPAR
jgi:hypothetical protein